ncbi:MAG: extracellular solute-binding protein, partial [Lactobacillus crispatus]|nr:extracellular solute-binding protein [Lactobacillus crispatus]
NKDSAIVIMTSSRIPAMKKLIGDKFKWNVAPIPTVNADDKQGAFPSGAGLYIINRDDKNKVKAAWIFNQFMISNEAQSMWLEKTGYVPVNQKVLESEAYKKALTDNPQIAVAFNTLKNTGDIVNKIIKETMLKFGKHEISMDEAQTQLASGVQKAFDEYYKLNPES